jgi:hypothetical protein
MGAGIAATNAQPLAAAIRVMRNRLDDWLVLLDAGAGEEPPNAEALRERFAAARARLEDGG